MVFPIKMRWSSLFKKIRPCVSEHMDGSRSYGSRKRKYRKSQLCVCVSDMLYEPDLMSYGESNACFAMKIG